MTSVRASGDQDLALLDQSRAGVSGASEEDPLPPSRRDAGRLPVGELAMAAGFVLLGIAGLVGASQIPEPPTTNTMGPRVVPYVVSTLLLVCALLVIGLVLRGNRGVEEASEDADENAKVDVKTVSLLIATVLGTGIAIPYVGWPVASSALFTCAVMILGGSWWRGLIAGAAIGCVTQLLFGEFLGVSLPAIPEWLEDLL